MKNKSMKTLVVVSSLAGILSIGGILAYFTDKDTAVNTFTVGKISQELTEPDWNPEDAKNLTPNKEIAKNPQVTNDGINSQFVFMEVVVPYANLVTANPDGSLNAAADTELFSYTVNNGWTQLGEAVKNSEDGTVTHRYVYGTASACTALEKDVTTPAIFDSVTFANVVEEQGLENTSTEITINSYGIQTTDVNGGKTDPTSVWSVISNQ